MALLWWDIEVDKQKEEHRYRLRGKEAYTYLLSELLIMLFKLASQVSFSRNAIQF